MTHPTKVIYGELLRDFVRVTRGNADDQLYKEEDLKASLDRIHLLDFHQTIDVDGIQVLFRPSITSFVQKPPSSIISF